MNFSKPKANGTKQPAVRTKTVIVPKPATPARTPARPSDPNRFKTALERGNAKSHASKKPSNPAQRAVATSRGTKRKSTPPVHVFGDDDDDDSSDVGASDSDVSRKRIKSSVSSVESSRPRRIVISEEAFREDAVFDFVHGADATSGIHASGYTVPWDDVFKSAELQYPSRGQKEKFELKWPKIKKEDYNPMEDICETIDTICLNYLPADVNSQYLSEDTGFRRRINHAFQLNSAEEFIKVVDDFNQVLQGHLEDDTIRKGLLTTNTLNLEWVKRILTQIYVRTVSPKVETLRVYQNGSDNVYGELLPRFISEILCKTELSHEQVFVDLGSGVGNVVLQAALEVGAESWGIEMMKNPCDLAEQQAKEFPARTRLWGLSAGEVNLLRGDFTENPRIGELLKRADVVLVNNQAFTPALNNKLRDMFFDLKDGCQVVSLKPFVPDGHKISTRNYSSIANQLIQKRFEYFSGSVSWTDRSGYYYIATKDPGPLMAYMKQHNLQ